MSCHVMSHSYSLYGATSFAPKQHWWTLSVTSGDTYFPFLFSLAIYLTCNGVGTFECRRCPVPAPLSLSEGVLW